MEYNEYALYRDVMTPAGKRCRSGNLVSQIAHVRICKCLLVEPWLCPRSNEQLAAPAVSHYAGMQATNP